MFWGLLDNFAVLIAYNEKDRLVVQNLQSRVQTHAILVIGLYELLGNPTIYLIEPPVPSLTSYCHNT
jgi:hypothetical protein